MKNILDLGEQSSQNSQHVDLFEYSFDRQSQRFALFHSQINLDAQKQAPIVRIELDINGMILDVLKADPELQITCEDINIYDHHSFLYGDLIIDKEDHKSDYHKEVYKQLKVFKYKLVPFVRIMKIEETFHNFRPRKLSVTNEFHHLEDLNLELDLEQEIRDAISKKQN